MLFCDDVDGLYVCHRFIASGAAIILQAFAVGQGEWPNYKIYYT